MRFQRQSKKQIHKLMIQQFYSAIKLVSYNHTFKKKTRYEITRNFFVYGLLQFKTINLDVNLSEMFSKYVELSSLCRVQFLSLSKCISPIFCKRKILSNSEWPLLKNNLCVSIHQITPCVNAMTTPHLKTYPQQNSSNRVAYKVVITYCITTFLILGK